VFSHVFVSVSDFERALRFYGALMDRLGVELRFCERERPWAGWHSAGGARPFFVICKPMTGSRTTLETGKWSPSQRPPGRPSERHTKLRWTIAEPVRDRQAYAPGTTTTTTARTFATRTGTNCASRVTLRRSTVHEVVAASRGRQNAAFSAIWSAGWLKR
jgi:hypothetical protein